jgi:hypothetical protein
VWVTAKIDVHVALTSCLCWRQSFARGCPHRPLRLLTGTIISFSVRDEAVFSAGVAWELSELIGSTCSLAGSNGMGDGKDGHSIEIVPPGSTAGRGPAGAVGHHPAPVLDAP